jgi:hypothetical protein
LTFSLSAPDLGSTAIEVAAGPPAGGHSDPAPLGRGFSPGREEF